jgi:biotin operon repressor
MSTFGPAYEAKHDEKRIKSQMETVKQVLQQAAQYDCWMTLAELARKTKYPEASISAQIRHLRKPWFGGYKIEKRRVGIPSMGLWEYRMTLPEAPVTTQEAA